MTDTAIIATFFNPLNSTNRKTNVVKFLDFISRCGLDDHFFIHEILFQDQTPFIQHKNVSRLKTNSCIWHKERSLNILAKSLPRQYSKVIWVDTDIIWDNRDWAKETSKLLDTYNMVHPLSSLRYLNCMGSVTHVSKSYLQNVLEEDGSAPASLTPTCFGGGAMGYKRELYDTIGLFDKAIIGGADSLMCYALNLKDGRAGRYFKRNSNDIEFCKERLAYCEKYETMLDHKLAVLQEEAVHLYHGVMKRRQYVERHVLIENMIFNEQFHISPETQLYEFSLHSDPNLATEIIQYFKSRQEDESQPIIADSILYKCETHSETKLPFMWIKSSLKLECFDVSRIRLHVSNNGNPYASSRIEVMRNADFPNADLPITHEIGPVSVIEMDLNPSQINIIELIGNQSFFPFQNNMGEDRRELSFILNKIEIITGNSQEYKDFPLASLL